MTQPILTLADGYPFDLQRFLESRGLFTAASGYGKSWALRRLLEQMARHVQIIVIDPDGEFDSLREEFDLLVCAPSGADAVANPETAAMLVRFLLETGVSAVFNIFELKAEDRQKFVKNVCNALVDAPQKLWHPVQVVLDEAHIYCPEGVKSECGQAVIDLATRGRKRGFGLVMATQRLSALNKNAAAQCLNKLIGKTSMDTDIKRAADELGRSPKQMASELRELGRGEFFAYGPAFPDGIQQVKIGPVITRHPEPGKRGLEAPPKPSAKLQKLLADRLQDLPKQAEEEARSMEQLREENRRLRVAAGTAPAALAGPSEEEILQRIEAVRRETWLQAIAELTSVLPKIKEIVDSAWDRMAEHKNFVIHHLISTFKPYAGWANKSEAEVLETLKEQAKARGKEPSGGWPVIHGWAPTPPTEIKREIKTHETGGSKIPQRPFVKPTEGNGDKSDKLSGPQQVILDTMAKLVAFGMTTVNKTLVAVFAGVSPTSSSFANNIGRLHTLELLSYPSAGMLSLSAAGRKQAHYPGHAPTIREIQQAWRDAVSGPQAAILDRVIQAYPNPIPRDDLAIYVKASPSSSSFANNIGRLRSLGAIDYPQTGMVKATSLLFPGRE